MINNKILLVYFIYLSFGCVVYLISHNSEFPTKYVFTDWLINYEGGFVRRGFLGQIILEISNFLNIQIKLIILFFQIVIYLIYYLLFFYFFTKIKANFFGY